MDYTALNTLLITNPDALDLSALDINDHTVAAILNSAPPAALAQVTPVTSVGRGDFLKAIIPATDQLATGVALGGAALSQTAITKWTYRFAALRSGSADIPVDAALSALVTDLVTDGLMSQAQLNAFTARPMSYAEVKFGAGTVIDWTDVMQARRDAGHRINQESV